MTAFGVSVPSRQIAVGVGLLGVLAGSALADLIPLSQSRGIRCSAYAREGGDVLLNEDQIFTTSAGAFNEDLIVAAMGPNQDAQASSGGVYQSRIDPLALHALIATNGVTDTFIDDTGSEARGEAWFQIEFALDQPHEISIEGIIDSFLFNGDDWYAESLFELRVGDQVLFETSDLGEFDYTAELPAGIYEINASVVTVSRSADGAGLNLANLRQIFDVDFVVVPSPASALPVVLLLGGCGRRQRAS